MNEKQAKALRREAIQLAAQMVQHGRAVSTERQYAPQTNLSDTVINRPDSLRGIYRYLKKNK